MNSNLKLLPAALLVAMLALAGCGGSDSTPEPEPTPEPAPDPGPSALEQAVDAAGDAQTARMMAEKLSKDAIAASGKLTTKAVNGDSMAAYNNTMQVLTVEDAIMTQQNAAMAAVEKLEGIDVTGMSDAAQARIGRLLEDAMEDLDAIKAILADDGALMAAIDKVIGTSSDTAAELARANSDTVAAAIATAIQNTGLASTVGFDTWDSIAHASVPDHSPIPGDDDPVMRGGKSGKTFAQISGSEGPMKVAKLGDFMTTADPPAAIAEVVSGTPTPTAYKGIPGSLICVVSTGNCSADTGSIYFVPTNAFHLYKSDGEDGYVQQKNAAHYGYWLDADAAIQHHVSSDSIADDGTTNILEWGDGDDTAVKTVTATYQGMAGGYSERTVGEGDNERQSSGEFTANVNLKATFHDSDPDTLQGTISGFAAKAGSSGSGHVNPAWVVGLLRHSATFAANAVIANDATDPAGTFSTEYRNGEEGATGGRWTATAYGDDGKHPTGFVGAFNADFEDGSAAGVYNAD